MKKVIRLTENDLIKIVKRVISEQTEPTDKDFKLATTVAAEVENWWKGQTRDSFFESFQGALNDEDDEAAESYNKKLDTYRTMLRNRLTGGSTNQYYKQINEWFIKIVDEIDDWFQHPCRVDLIGPDGETMKYYSVDPEID